MWLNLIFFVIIGLFAPSAQAEEPAADSNSTSISINQLIINEIYPNPITGSKEWVELFNAGDSAIDIEDWYLCDNRSTSCTIAKITGIIEPKQWLLINLSSNYLNNDGDSVILYDQKNIAADRVDYGSTLPAPKKGEALARATDGDDHDRDSDWSRTADPTPGYANYITPIDQPVGAIIYSPPLKPAPPEPKPTTITTTAPKTIIPPTIHWKVNLPTLAIVHTTTTLQVSETADTRGGIIFYSWLIASSTYEGQVINHRFSASGLWPVTIAAASTSGSTGTYRGNLWVAAPTTTPIRITELYPDDEIYSEFIELYNTGTSTADVSAWRIVLDNGNQFTIPPSTTLSGGAYAIFSKAATGLSLSNTGATVYLLSSSTTLADSIIYEKISRQKSYQLTDDGWRWAAPTPGTPPLPLDNADITEEIVTIASEAINIPPLAKHSIAKARELPIGTRTTVRGQVAVMPGVFSSQSWYLVDATGGLQIYKQNKQFPPLTLGQWADVTGVVSLANGIPRIKAEKIQIGTQTVLNASTTSIAEATEQPGKLVSIEGEITKRLASQLYIDDGADELLVTIKKGTNITTNEYRLGDIVSITGIIEQTIRGHELWPRSTADVFIIKPGVQPSDPKQTQQRPNNFIVPGILFIGALVFVIKKIKKSRFRD